MHSHTTWQQLALELLQSTATLLGGSGKGPLAMYCHTACGQLALVIMLRTATVPRGSGQGPPTMHYHTAWSVGGGAVAMQRHAACR